MFFELRDYTAKPGQRDRLARIMDEELIPYQVSLGMVVVGSFKGRDDDDKYYWIRRFESEEEKERLYQAVYQSEHWNTYFMPLVEELLHRDQIKVTIIEPTPKSILR